MKTVHYTAVTIGPIAVGNRVELIPINHPGYQEFKGTSLQVVNGLPCFTTPIHKVYPDGTTFDTLNTHYVHWHIADEADSMIMARIAQDEPS